MSARRSPLLTTHPALGLAQWEAQWQEDVTGDYPAQQFCKILRHDYTVGRCRHCGGREHRHIVLDRMLVGCNAGKTRWTGTFKCEACGTGGCSNYRIPWVDW